MYEAIIMSTTLYGCECWSLTEPLSHRLRVMQAQHFRAMSRITRKHAWDHHISTQQLGRELGIPSIDHLIARRQLRYAGHISRMDFDHRLPRRMLSSWVPHSRPAGAPTMTYGRSLGRALDHFWLDRERWHELAADRSAWRAMLRAGVIQRVIPKTGAARRGALCVCEFVLVARLCADPDPVGPSPL